MCFFPLYTNTSGRVYTRGLAVRSDGVLDLPATMALDKLLLIDCDSTLSALEGIDELGRLKGPDVFRRVEEMTHDAMEGRLAVEAVFGRRLEIIQPRVDDLRQVGQRYLETSGAIPTSAWRWRAW